MRRLRGVPHRKMHKHVSNVGETKRERLWQIQPQIQQRSILLPRERIDTTVHKKQKREPEAMSVKIQMYASRKNVNEQS